MTVAASGRRRDADAIRRALLAALERRLDQREQVLGPEDFRVRKRHDTGREARYPPRPEIGEGVVRDDLPQSAHKLPSAPPVRLLPGCRQLSPTLGAPE